MDVMTSKTKSGLYFGIFMLIFLIIKGLITENNFTAINVTGIVVSALIAATIAGILYGGINSKILMKKNGKKV